MIPISKPIIGDEEIKAVMKVLQSGKIVQGEQVKILEEKFCKLCNSKFAVALNSGTAAIHAGLYAIGVGHGDEVITTPFTFVASANPILMQGAKIVFVDINENNYLIDPEEVRKKINENTKAIIGVSLYGQVFDYEKIREVTKGTNIKIIEDACQSIGASRNGKMSGMCGDIGTFSLYATKNIMCGEGGILTTNNEEFAEKAKMFRHHGQSETQRYEYLDLGYNYRLTDLAASIANVQLERLNNINRRRQENGKAFLESLSGIKGLVLPCTDIGNTHVYHQFTLRITQDAKISREELTEQLNKDGIGTNIYYPKPLHLHPHFINHGFKQGDFPVAEKISKEVFSIPVHPSLSKEEITFIIKKINEYLR